MDNFIHLLFLNIYGVIFSAKAMQWISQVLIIFGSILTLRSLVNDNNEPQFVYKTALISFLSTTNILLMTFVELTPNIQCITPWIFAFNILCGMLMVFVGVLNSLVDEVES